MKKILFILLTGLHIFAPGSFLLSGDDQVARQNEVLGLIEELGSESWEIAIDRLAAVGEPAVPALIKALADYSGHRYKPYRAALALGKIGSDRAAEALIIALGDEETQNYVYRGITRALADIGSPEAEEALIATVQRKDLDDYIRGPAAAALGVFETERAVKCLAETLTDEKQVVRNYAAGALAEVATAQSLEILLAALEKDPGFLLNPSVRTTLEKKSSERGIDILINVLKSEEWYVWSSAFKILGEIGGKAEDRLIEALGNRNVRTRQKAALLLGAMKSQRAEDALIVLLEDEDWKVGEEAAVALAKLPGRNAVDALIGLLEHESPDVRQRASWILGEWKPERAVGSLVAALKDNDAGVREMAARALQKTGTPQAMQALHLNRPGMISFGGETYPTYPATLDRLPGLPSPYRTDDGLELILVGTTDKKFAIIPVTVENGKPYIYAREGKGRQLDVDAADFPTLARTGLHSVEELNTTKTITGISISEITDIGRPGRASGAGFMGPQEDIISVLRGDNRLVRSLGLTHPQTARALFHVWNMILEHAVAYYDEIRPWDDIAYFLYNGKKVFIEYSPTKGWQESIFNDEIIGGYQISLRRELDESEEALLKQKYPMLSAEKMSDFFEKLTRLFTGEIGPFYIMRYGFYEGHTDYRADPLAIAFVFGLKTLEEIESAFPGKIYETLIRPFTRER